MEHYRLKEIIREELEVVKTNQTRLEEILLSKKPVLNIRDLCDYTGYSRSYIYKLTSRNAIPYFKPSGKMVFFEREEIDSWLLRNKQEVKEQSDGRTIEV
tara:strand:+ start:466 stop:765 length:300 start_codon:yes stop_codon:yes gene_type:complete